MKKLATILSLCLALGSPALCYGRGAAGHAGGHPAGHAGAHEAGVIGHEVSEDSPSLTGAAPNMSHQYAHSSSCDSTVTTCDDTPAGFYVIVAVFMSVLILIILVIRSSKE